MAATSKITVKGRTTVPREVRKAINSKPGDLLAGEIDDGCVAILRINALDAEYLQAVQRTLNEWNTAEDDKAYGKL